MHYSWALGQRNAFLELGRLVTVAGVGQKSFPQCQFNPCLPRSLSPSIRLYTTGPTADQYTTGTTGPKVRSRALYIWSPNWENLWFLAKKPKNSKFLFFFILAFSRSLRGHLESFEVIWGHVRSPEVKLFIKKYRKLDLFKQFNCILYGLVLASSDLAWPRMTLNDLPSSQAFILLSNKPHICIVCSRNLTSGFWWW